MHKRLVDFTRRKTRRKAKFFRSPVARHTHAPLVEGSNPHGHLHRCHGLAGWSASGSRRRNARCDQCHRRFSAATETWRWSFDALSSAWRRDVAIERYVVSRSVAWPMEDAGVLVEPRLPRACSATTTLSTFFLHTRGSWTTASDCNLQLLSLYPTASNRAASELRSTEAEQAERVERGRARMRDSCAPQSQ